LTESAFDIRRAECETSPTLTTLDAARLPPLRCAGLKGCHGWHDSRKQSMSVVVNQTDQLVHFLKNVKLFSDLSPDSLAKLGTCLKTAEFPPAEVIVREGAPGVSMYIVKSGLVEVRKKDPATGID